jgi:arylsulfatase A-like enzyme
MDQLAEESMVFDRAVEESLPTLPVRRALHTGMRTFPFTKRFFSAETQAIAAQSTFLGVPQALVPGWEPIPWDQPTIAELVGSKGYRTSMICDTGPLFQIPAMNYDRGFGHWEFLRGHMGDRYAVPSLAKKSDLKRFVPPWMEGWEVGAVMLYLAKRAKWQGEEDQFAPRVFSSAIQWLEDSRQAKDPFFLYIDSFDPHEPFDPPRKYVEMYDPGYQGLEMIWPFYGSTERLSESELKHMRALYAGAVTMVDTWFGKFVDKLRELGLLDNTLLILTSDHGHKLGEHGLAGKIPDAMYWELMDAPLMIRHPQGIGAGKRSDGLVQHQDIAPTILGFLGIEPPSDLDGKDLMPIVEGKRTKVRDYATCGYSLSVWARDDDYVLICSKTGEEAQLFDMGSDPEQRQNIAKDKPKVVKRLFDLVLADAKGGPILPNDPEFNEESQAWLYRR